MPRPARTRPLATVARAKREQQQQQQQPESRGRTRNTRSAASGSTKSDERATQDTNPSPEASTAPPSTTIPASDPEQSPKEKARRTPARRDTSGIDLADSVFLDLDDSFQDAAGADTPPNLAGTRSTDTSTFQLSHAKPRSRSRASSFIGSRNEGVIRPSSRGGQTPLMGSSFNIGAFRRRAREPSILGAARRPVDDSVVTVGAGVSQETHVSDTDSEMEDSFAPEAESTPVNNTRRLTRPAQAQEEEENGSELELPDLRRSSRKRKSGDDVAESDRPEKVLRSSENLQGEELEPAEDAQTDDSESDSDSELSSLPSHSPMLNRPRTPVNQSDYAAPPASSSSAGDEAWPSIHTLAKARSRRRLSVNELSDLSSPPSLTHSPNFADKRTRAAAKVIAEVKLTTADLTNLLPKRRARRRAEEAEENASEDEVLDTAGIGEDEDELSYLDATRRRRKKRATAATAVAAKAGPSKGKAPQTYTRRNSDKENEQDRSGDEEENEEEEGERSRFVPLPDDTFDTTTVGDRRPSSSLTADELKAAAKKFKEVDRWELDFEEATQPSSPIGAR